MKSLVSFSESVLYILKISTNLLILYPFYYLYKIKFCYFLLVLSHLINVKLKYIFVKYNIIKLLFTVLNVYINILLLLKLGFYLFYYLGFVW